MATHAIHSSQRINLSQISYMLIAAGLGAGLMFILDATFLKASDMEISKLRDEVQRLESSNTALESQVRDLSDQNRDLNVHRDELSNEKSLLIEKLAAKDADLLGKEKQLEEFSLVASKLATDTKALSICVLEDKKNVNSAKGLISDAVSFDLGLGDIPEAAIFLRSVHSSWSTGNCASASDIAAKYQAQ